jgi:hypothetical protein
MRFIRPLRSPGSIGYAYVSQSRRPGPNTIHQYDPTMNVAKKTTASANWRNGEPPIRVTTKVPSNAVAPTTAQTAVTTLAVTLANMNAPFELVAYETIVPSRWSFAP